MSSLWFVWLTIAVGRYSLNIWDVGGQTTIRSYWRNYFERTDGLIWVVDSADIRRLKECRAHLHDVLREEVRDIELPFCARLLIVVWRRDSKARRF